MLNSGKLKAEDYEPDLGPFDFYYLAFNELSTCRQIGMGVGPIPFTALVEYSRIYDIDDFESFKQIIGIMDRQYLKLQAEKMEKTGGKTNGKHNSNSSNPNPSGHKGKSGVARPRR